MKRLYFFLFILLVYLTIGFYFSFTYFTVNTLHTFKILFFSIIINFIFYLIFYKSTNKLLTIIKLKDRKSPIKILSSFIISYDEIIFIFIIFSIIFTGGHILKINSFSYKKINISPHIIKIQYKSDYFYSNITLLDVNKEKRYGIIISPTEIKKLKIGDIYKITIYEGWLGIKFYKTKFLSYKKIEP